MRHRRGFSLIEVIVAMGAMMVILGLCASGLTQLVRLSRASEAARSESIAVDRLARSWRRHAHEASGWTTWHEPGGGRIGRLVWTLPGERVAEYRLKGSKLLVSEFDPAWPGPRRSLYPLGGPEASIRLVEDGDAKLAVLTLSRTTRASGPGRATPIVVDAAMGLVAARGPGRTGE